MSKFSAKYALLPSSKSEYVKIINAMINGMSKNDADNLISKIKVSKIKFKYKHRTSLEAVGVLITKENKVYLSEVAEQIKRNEVSIEEGLKILIDRNEELVNLFKLLVKYNYINGKKSKNEVVEILHNEYFLDTPQNTLKRYLNPILKLFDISKYSLINQNTDVKRETTIKFESKDIQNDYIINTNYKNILKQLQILYLKEVVEYGEILAIEKISNMLKNEMGLSGKIIEKFWNKMYNDTNKQFRYIFTTLPYWGTKTKSIDINGQTFTHIILLKNIYEED